MGRGLQPTRCLRRCARHRSCSRDLPGHRWLQTRLIDGLATQYAFARKTLRCTSAETRGFAWPDIDAPAGTVCQTAQLKDIAVTDSTDVEKGRLGESLYPTPPTDWPSCTSKNYASGWRRHPGNGWPTYLARDPLRTTEFLRLGGASGISIRDVSFSGRLHNSMFVLGADDGLTVAE